MDESLAKGHMKQLFRVIEKNNSDLLRIWENAVTKLGRGWNYKVWSKMLLEMAKNEKDFRINTIEFGSKRKPKCGFLYWKKLKSIHPHCGKSKCFMHKQ